MYVVDSICSGQVMFVLNRFMYVPGRFLYVLDMFISVVIG